VSRITEKSNRPISLKLGIMNWLTCGGDPLLDTHSRSLFPFPHHCRDGILGDLLAPGDDSCQNESRQQKNPLHFGSDPADIRIQINPKIWMDSNPISLLVEILALAKFTLFKQVWFVVICIVVVVVVIAFQFLFSGPICN